MRDRLSQAPQPTLEPEVPQDSVQKELVLQQLQRILSGPTFCRSTRLARFLTFIVQQTLHGRADELKEYLVGVEVFDRKESFDPRSDPIVRVEAGRLRTKLETYYRTEGRDDEICIELPIGGYTPEFRRASPNREQGRPTRDNRERWLLAILAVTAAALGVALLSPARQPSNPPPLHLSLNNPTGVAYQAFALSPDGTRVAFVGEGTSAPSLWVQSLSDRSSQPLPGTESADPVGTPFWSPDGRQIGFFADGFLKRIPAEGGGAQSVCAAQSGRGGAWNKDDVILFAPSAAGGLWKADLGTGTCVPALERGPDDFGLRSPQFLPDQDHFLFTRRKEATIGDVFVGSLLSGKRSSLLEEVQYAAYVESEASGHGYLLYVRENTLHARRFNAGSLSFDSSEVAVAHGVGFDINIGRGLFSASPNGVLIYMLEGIQSRTRELGWFGRAGEYLGGAAQVSVRDFSIDLAPGASWAVFSHDGLRGTQRLDMRTGISTGIAGGTAPALSPKGDEVFSTFGNGIVRAPLGGGPSQTLVAADDGQSEGSPINFLCSSSDRLGLFLYQRSSAETGWDLWSAPLNGEAEPQLFLRTSFDEGHGQFSPDGNWVAYTSNESGRREVYVRAFPSGDRKGKISSDGGSLPRWRSDGAELFYIDGKGLLTAIAVQQDKDGIRPGRAKGLLPVSAAYAWDERYKFAPMYTYDVTQDGQRFLVVWRPPEMPFPPLQVLVNWEALLER